MLAVIHRQKNANDEPKNTECGLPKPTQTKVTQSRFNALQRTAFFGAGGFGVGTTSPMSLTCQHIMAKRSSAPNITKDISGCFHSTL